MRTSVVSCGWSELSKPGHRYEGDLALDACVAALRAAGLSARDVDGVATHPGSKGGSIGPLYVATGLGLRDLRWYADVGGGPAAPAALFAAVGAIEAGLARRVLVFRAISRPVDRGAGGVVPGDDLPDDWAFKVPYGCITAPQWMAMWATHHMARFGTKPEHLGAVAVAARAHASRNARAVMREPLDLDAYLESPIVSEPFRLLDCDVPIDGAVALVLAGADEARDLCDHPVRIEAMSCAPGPVPDWDQWEDFRWMAARYAADDMWRQAPDFGPADIDVAELYDGFTFLVISWLEALGFCELGDGGPFVADGRIGPGGSQPVNTHGGSLSEGRLHGISHLAEAVMQLQGRAGDSQIPEARVAVATAGGGPLASSVLLRREDR